MVFVDDAAPVTAADAETPVLVVAPEPGLFTRVSNTRRARRTTAAAGAAVVLLGVLLGVTLSSASPPTRHRNPAPVARQSPAGGHTSPAKHTGSQTSSVSAPPSALVARHPTAAQPHQATYDAPASPYTVSISASGLCWVLAEETASGHVLWTGTLQAGNVRSFSGSGALQVHLGAASDVSVSVNGVPLVLPAGFQSPFDVDLTA